MAAPTQNFLLFLLFNSKVDFMVAIGFVYTLIGKTFISTKICDKYFKKVNQLSYPKHNICASLQTLPTRTFYSQCHPVCKYEVNFSSIDNKVVINEFHS